MKKDDVSWALECAKAALACEEWDVLRNALRFALEEACHLPEPVAGHSVPPPKRPPRPDAHPTRALKAQMAGVSMGVVKRMDTLEKHRPDLADRVAALELTGPEATNIMKREAKLTGKLT